MFIFIHRRIQSKEDTIHIIWPFGEAIAIRVISVTNSNSLVHKMRIVKRFDF